ncbi:MAG: hypothetical protein Q4F79_07415 [Eubacteriales bacterium]|nr:hypothetical protein [Eubacteriales bacterium]
MEKTEHYGFNIFSNPDVNYPNESIPGNWQALLTKNMIDIDSKLKDLENASLTHLLESALLDLVYPVGSIRMSANNVNPGTTIGGTWVAWGAGRVPVGVNTSDTNFSAAEKTGGASTVALATANLPAHAHGLNNHTHSFSGSNTTSSNGGHTHSVPVSGTTGGEAAHTHSLSVTGTAATAGSHRHDLQLQYNSSVLASGSSKSQVTPSPTGGSYASTDYKTMYVDGHKHTVSASGTSGKGSNHTHSFSATGTAASNGAHTHTVSISGTTGGNSGSTANTGSGTAHNNLQPYITCYFWKRTA